MKKFLKIFSIFILAILILLIATPILFKSKIEKIVKDKVNENVHAIVNWEHFGLNFFRGFPSMSLNLKGMSVTGLAPFDGDTLAGFDRFELRVKPFSAIKGDIVVEAIILFRPLINGIVLEDGIANWDIAPDNSQPDPEDPDNDSGSMDKGIRLKRFSIIDGRVFYKDAVMGAAAALKGLNVDLWGDFSMEETDMELEISASSIDAKYGGIRYLKGAEFEMQVAALADLVNSVYTIKESEIVINGLALGVEGSVGMPNESDLVLDISYNTRETTFKTLLSMVPAIYMEGFESLKTSGAFQLSGSVNGIMNDTRNPDATLHLVVKDGYFGYPDLPKDVTDVQIELDLKYNGEDEDLTTIDLHTFHMEMAGNPVDVNLHMANPISDMNIRGLARGVVDFSTLSDVVLMEEVALGGKLEADITINTRMSYIENEDFEKVDVKGRLIISDVTINTPDLPAPVDLTKIDMVFSPKFVSLNSLDARMGASDIHMDGSLRNLVPYLFNGKTVFGELNVTSNLLDANPYLSEPDSLAQTDSNSEDMLVSVSEDSEELTDTTANVSSSLIPENIEFKMKIDVGRVLYDKITLDNLSGYIYTKDGVARFDKLIMDMMEGKVTLIGTIDTRSELVHVNMKLDADGIDIPQSYETFVTVEKLAPMAKFCKGTVNTKLNYESFLDDSFDPVYESINADGELFTKGLQIYNLNSFVKLSELLKNEKFRNMTPDEIFVSFRVKDGRVIVDPFDIDFEDSKMKVSGSHGIDLTMDYNLDMQIATKDLGAGANELLSGVSALAAGAGFKIPATDFVKVKAHIGGTFSDPKISTDLSDNLKRGGEAVEEQVRELVTEEIQAVEEDVRERASDEADKIIKNAEAEGARLIEQAEIAGAELIKEAEKQAEFLLKEAGSNPLKKLAAQKAGDELKKQAVKQSDNLVNEARTKAGQIIEQAKSEAAKIEQ